MSIPLEGKGDHSVVDEVSPLPLSEQLKQIKYLYVEKSDMEKTFYITYASNVEEERQVKIKAPSKYRAKQIFYLTFPKCEIVRIEEKQNERN